MFSGRFLSKVSCVVATTLLCSSCNVNGGRVSQTGGGGTLAERLTPIFMRVILPFRNTPIHGLRVAGMFRGLSQNIRTMTILPIRIEPR